MDARQRVKLSLTNRSIGLIHRAWRTRRVRRSRRAKAARPKAQRVPRAAASLPNTSRRQNNVLTCNSCPLGPGDLVVMARFQTPDPIPNSAVKHLSANGTAS